MIKNDFSTIFRRNAAVFNILFPKIVSQIMLANTTSQHLEHIEMSLANHLIIVCGHAIWLGGPRKGYDEAEWLIESYKAGETPTFIEHIKAGVEALGKDERAILMFSGYVKA